MAAKKSPPEKDREVIDLGPENIGKFTDLEPAPSTGQAPAAESQQYAKGVPEPAEDPARANVAASTFNEETRREVAAKALAEKIVEAKALELTVDELTQGIDLALENMAAGMTQSEAVRLAAEDIRKQKQDIPF